MAVRKAAGPPSQGRRSLSPVDGSTTYTRPDAPEKEVSMRDVLGEVVQWYAQGRPFALATVVRTWKSAPRQAGAAMAVSTDGEAVGSVSGGCVEGAVYTLAQEV